MSPPTLSLVGVPDTIAPKARKEAITTRLLTMGANIGTANLSWALSRPPAMAARPYRKICGANRRSMNVASACWDAASGPESRELKMEMIHGAVRKATTVTARRTAAAVLTSLETTSHASSWGRVRSSATTTGMNTELRTPPSTSS